MTDAHRTAVVVAAHPELFESLISAAGYEIVQVVSQPDRRRGRGSKLIQSAVKQAAIELDVPVGDDPDELLDLDLDLAVVVAFGRIIPRRLLEVVPMVNVHFSLLPRWRGAAPVERAIMAGDQETGVCIMAMAERLDEGDVYACQAVDIGENESASELTGRLSTLGAELLVETLRPPLPEPVPQTGDATYATKIARSESELCFDDPALALHRRVRAMSAWTTFRGRRLGIEDARVVPGRLPSGEPALSSTGAVVIGTGHDLLELQLVKPEGRRAMTANDWWNGAQPVHGERLGR